MKQYSSVANQGVNLRYTRCGAATASAQTIRQQWLQQVLTGHETPFDQSSTAGQAATGIYYL